MYIYKSILMLVVLSACHRSNQGSNEDPLLKTRSNSHTNSLLKTCRIKAIENVEAVSAIRYDAEGLKKQLTKVTNVDEGALKCDIETFTSERNRCIACSKPRWRITNQQVAGY